MHKGRNKITDQLNSEDNNTNEKPPILGSWNNIYLVVLLNLTAIIIFLYLFSEVFK
jgi:hypothetical protein